MFPSIKKVTFRDQHRLSMLQFLIFTTFCGLRIDRRVQSVKTVFLLFCPPLYWSADSSDLQAAVTSTHFALWHSWTQIKLHSERWFHVFLLILNNAELKTSNCQFNFNTHICGLYSNLCWMLNSWEWTEWVWSLDTLTVKCFEYIYLYVYSEKYFKSSYGNNVHKKSLFQMWKVFKLIYKIFTWPGNINITSNKRCEPIITKDDWD